MRARVSVVVLAVALIASAPVRAYAAFELRDASPEALGAVSIDVGAEPMFGPLARAGIRLGASHSSLYQVEGLVQDRAAAGIEGGRGSLSLNYARAGVPGAVESSARLALRESRARAVALELSAERLDLALDGEPREGGWAFGGAARARASFPRFDLEIALAADRVLRSASLDRLGVAPSVPFSIGVRSRDAAAAWIDRWEGSGRRSPRLVVDLPVTRAARLRLGRGECPGRIGVALAVQWRRLEVSAGRLDLSEGGVITAAAISRVPRPAGEGR